jgi:glutathione S-transferase
MCRLCAPLFGMSVRRATVAQIAYNRQMKTPDERSVQHPLLTIYHLEGRRSERIVWFCEEIGLPYELVFKPGDLAGSIALIREFHPQMPVAPVVRYEDVTLMESGAILQLLQERHAHGRLAPGRDSRDYPHYLQWLHFAEGSAAPRLISEFLLGLVKGGEMPPIVQSQIGKAAQTLAYLDDYLSKHAYFGGGEFSIADIMMHFDVQFAKMIAHFDTTPAPNLLAWLATVERRPAFHAMRQVALPNGFIGVPDTRS